MHPDWLRVKLPTGSNYREMKGILREKGLHTVCEEALCPNIGECFEQRTATFLILGNICTRQCGFCAVKKGQPSDVFMKEPQRIASAVKEMQLNYVVITSVTRDDLSDGGAFVYAKAIKLIRRTSRECYIEVLIPDFQGSQEALQKIIDAGPDIINHNIETVPRLYPMVRPKADYARSLQLLQDICRQTVQITTKAGLMLGLGERWDEVIEVMQSLRNIGCDILTIGQYLSPKKQSLPIQRYYTPDEFAALKRTGERMGYKHVVSGPLVRSSYHAHDLIYTRIYDKRSMYEN